MTTPILGLTEAVSNQYNLDITINEAFRRLEATTVRALSASVTAQPTSPADGDVYIITGTPTGGTWSTYPVNTIAYYRSNVWYGFYPRIGMNLFVVDVGRRYFFDGAIWDSLQMSVDLSSLVNDNLIGTPIYTKYLDDIISKTESAGITYGCAITNNGDGTISIGAGEALIRSGDATTQLYSAVIPDSSILTPADDATSYIYVSYNAGNPVWAVTQDPTSINLQDKIPRCIVVRRGTSLNIFDLGNDSIDSNASFRKRMFYTERFVREDGSAVLSSPSLLTLAVTAGKFWFGLKQVSTPSMSGGTFTTWYYNGTSWVSTTSQSSVSNTQYNNTLTGLVTLDNNKFGNHWVYVVADTEATPQYHVVYGQAQYASLAEAADASPPSSLPAGFESLGILLGVVTVQKGAASIVEARSAFTTPFSSAQVSSHNELGGIQGGASGEYFHLTSAEHTALQNIVANGAGLSYSYLEVSTNTTAVANSFYSINTAGGAVSLTLPIAPVAGKTFVRIADAAGTFSTNPLTILGNSKNIMGLAESLTVDQSRVSLELLFLNENEGWILHSVNM